MKFRIIEKDGRFYPQIKKFLFWGPLFIHDLSGMASCTDHKGVTYVYSKDNAIKLIYRYINFHTPIIHNVDIEKGKYTND